MFNFIKFSKGFEEGSKFYDIKELKKDKEFMQHKKDFEKNKYVVKNCFEEDLPVIDDIEMGQFFYKGKRNIMLNITAVGNAVDICLDVDIATGNIDYTVTSGIKEYITIEEYFNVNKANENVYYMIKKFAKQCIEKPFKVAEDIAEIINEDYKCTLDEEGTLTVEHNNVEVTVKDFPKIIMETDPDLDFNVEIGNVKGNRLNISELETADDIIETIRDEISKVWGD